MVWNELEKYSSTTSTSIKVTNNITPKTRYSVLLFITHISIIFVSVFLNEFLSGHFKIIPPFNSKMNLAKNSLFKTDRNESGHRRIGL